ncbi:MAG: hypothetical protein J5958_00685, partial [Clostridia bacterium]|nr:hypothetical protein [Clostridia bacterium]
AKIRANCFMVFSPFLFWSDRTTDSFRISPPLPQLYTFVRNVSTQTFKNPQKGRFAQNGVPVFGYNNQTRFCALRAVTRRKRQ